MGAMACRSPCRWLARRRQSRCCCPWPLTWRTSRSSSPELRSVQDRAGLNRLELVAGNGFQLVELIVVPARVGGPADVPAAAVVGDDHAVLLERGEYHQGLAVKRRQVE